MVRMVFGSKKVYQSSIFRLTRAVAVSYLISAAAVLILSWALYVMKWEGAGSETTIRGVYFIACTSGGFLAGKEFRQKRLFWGLLVGGLYAVILLTVSQLTGGLGSHGSLESILITGICLAGGGLGSFLS